jgi:archaemetzincin
MRSRLRPAVAILLLLAGPLGAAAPSKEDLKKLIPVLRPLHKRLGPPGPGDWLAVHHEDGQSFEQYLRCDPVLPTPKRRTLVVQPLGPFDAGQKKILDLTLEGMGLYLGLPVRALPPKLASAVPKRATRTSQDRVRTQFLTTYILDEMLQPAVPRDAVALIALTATDLWPGEGWNFVFGQATLQDRVGVWSMARLGDPAAGPASFRLVLLRTLGTAVHETCHMLSFEHCTAYECCMCGSNSLEEGDRHPLWLCPECLAKLCYATGADPVARYRALESYCRRNGLKTEAAFYLKSAQTLERRWHPAPRTGRDQGVSRGSPAPPSA